MAEWQEWSKTIHQDGEDIAVSIEVRPDENGIVRVKHEAFAGILVDAGWERKR